LAHHPRVEYRNVVAALDGGRQLDHATVPATAAAGRADFGRRAAGAWL
jgi:hypothetical protein